MPKRGSRGQRNKLSLTTLLIGLVSLSVLLTSTILLLASYQSKRQSLIDTTLQLNYTNANKMSQTIDSLFRSMRTSLQYSAKALSGTNKMSVSDRDEYLDLLRNSSNYFNSMAIIDEKGIIQNVSPQRLGTAGKEVNTIAGTDISISQTPFLSEPYRTSTTGRLIVIMTQPYFDEKGHYRGVIAGTLYLQDHNVLTMIFGSNNVDNEGSYYYIVGSDGKVLFHPDRSRIGQDATATKIVEKLLEGNSGQERVINMNGEEMLTGYSYVPANGWGVVVVSSNTMLHEQVSGHIKNILWYILMPFVLLLIAVIVIAHELARPFVFLANLVNKIGKEKVELPERKPHWNREADLLTKTVLLALADFQKQTDQLTQEALTDSLTGLTNRRNFENTMDQWIREDKSFSLIVMDVDKFKFVNDTYGHQAGDDVLRQVAQVITASVRPEDICCRYGGEEFVILLANTTIKDAYIVAERVRKAVAIGEVNHGHPITVSQGIAHFPSQARSSDHLFHLADQALYEAKESGRNRTVIAELR
ncbi:sensor domain-containing diguanylate cyclase [Paenibacillus wynnii]|uniref:sensor domain-containing diguanylate cyclase n=1 Tax=Paenibacillus wynnii TaxID=268407 RepID=UPI002793C963|nr:sensor domain-containing diguanylate cyclase [Paenibacillus wynnii]MDQ0196363.1 diguanylate cyclase (GGDEF)-like protein [Paenibacillus wynnii]